MIYIKINNYNIKYLIEVKKIQKSQVMKIIYQQLSILEEKVNFQIKIRKLKLKKQERL